MTSLILCHLVNSIMDRIKVGSLGSLCYIHLTSTSSTLCLCALLEVCFGIPHNITYQLCKATCMVGLFKSIAFECLCNLGITLAIGLTAHCKIHTHLGALTHEMCLQTVHDFLRTTLSNTNNMLCHI